MTIILFDLELILKSTQLRLCVYDQDFPEELQSLPNRTYHFGPNPLQTPPPDPILTLF